MKGIEGSVYMTCAEMGVPFIKEVYKRYADEYESRNLKYSFAGYYSKLNTQRIVNEWSGFFETDVDYNDIKGVSEHQQNIQADVDRLKLEWGVQTTEDYKFLIYLYNKYTKDIEFENPQQEDLYRDLCLARLELRKIQQGDSVEDLTKAQTRVLTLMNKLKLDDFNSNKPKNLSEQSLFHKIMLIDENNVQDIYKEPRKFADFNRYIEYIEKFSLRPLKNMLTGTREFDVDLTDLDKYNFDTDK